MNAIMTHETSVAGYPDALRDFLKMMPCGMVVFNDRLAVEGFNEDARKFFRESCDLREGMDLEELGGALCDMAANGYGEAEVLAGHIRAFEECTVDYHKFDCKHYRMSAKPAIYPGCGMSLVITDISDILESENILATRSKELASQRSSLSSRLKLVDALASQREAGRIGKQFAGRLVAILNRLEDALKNGNTNAGLAEIEKQREYAGLLALGGADSEFAERFKNSLLPTGHDTVPRIVFEHISSPRCGAALENDIISAAREGVMLIAVCGAAGDTHVSLRVFDGGMELCIHSDEQVVPDFETAESYMRLRKIANKMRAALETDTSNGFDLNLRCNFPTKERLPAALVALSDAELVRGVCETLGGGAEPILRCIAASPDIDMQKACQKYSPSVLITEPALIEKHASALKQQSSKLKIVAISGSGNSATASVRLYLNGYLPRDIRPESLRAAINGVMRGLKVWTGGASLDGSEEASRRYGLTEVEQSIIGMMGQGLSSEKIASALHYSQGSLRNMLSALYVKLGVSDRAQLTAFAILNGFTDGI